jgi:beta-N-acetylhexosaminidase
MSYDARVTGVLPRMCGQLLCVGFEGTSAPAELLGRIARSEVGTVILFRPNVADPVQLGALVADLRAAAPADLPLVVAVDQEGGLVQRVRAPATEWPPMMAVAAAGRPAVSEAVGRALGDELALLGIGWNFAPVLDVHTNPANPVIGNRAFGTTPSAVITHALAFWAGLRAAGVQGCGKHFPGHGDTTTDSHHELPVITHDEARVRAIELAPFAAAIRAGAEALMTAHVVFSAFVDGDLPATLSHRVCTQLLRDELGFAGLLVSDDLGMRAVADRYPIETLVPAGLMAGVDHFIIRGPQERQQAAHAALVRAAEADPAVLARIQQSFARVQAFKAGARVGMPARERLGAGFPPEAHRRLRAGLGGDPAAALAALPHSSPVAGD